MKQKLNKHGWESKKDGWHNVGSGHVGCGGCGPEGFIYEPISFVCILGASTGRGLMVPPSIHPPDTNHLSFHPDSNLLISLCLHFPIFTFPGWAWAGRLGFRIQNLVQSRTVYSILGEILSHKVHHVKKTFA